MKEQKEENMIKIVKTHKK